MAYNKTNWIANQTLVSANNLNKMEQGIEEAHNKLDGAINADDVDQKVQEALEEAKAYAKEEVAHLVGASQETLDTIEELGAALGNDANFAATVTRQIGEKLGKNENAASATKLQTARKIKVDGDVTGEAAFDGSKDVTIKISKKKKNAGPSSFSKESPYYRIGSLSTKLNGINQVITFKVTTFKGGSGILKMFARRASNSEPIDTNMTHLYWETVTGLEPDDYMLVCGTNEDISTSNFELWMKCNGTYQQHTFTILTETDFNSLQYRFDFENGNNAYTQPTEGYEVITSTAAPLKNSAEKLTTPRQINFEGAVTGTSEFDGSKDVTIVTKSRGCVCGHDSNTSGVTKHYFKVGSFVSPRTTTNTNLIIKVYNMHIHGDIGTLKIFGRTNGTSTIEQVNAVWETGIKINPDDYIVASGIVDGNAVFELWTRESRPYVKKRFEVISEQGMSSQEVPLWELYDNIGSNNAHESIPEGLTQTVSVLGYQNAQAYVDERIAALTQLLVAKGILEEELTTIPELEEDIETEE